MRYPKTSVLALAILPLALSPASAQEARPAEKVAVATPAPAAPPAAPAADPAPADTAAAEPDPGERAPAAIEVGVGTVKFSGLVQAWYSTEEDGEVSTFRLRRAEMKFAGDLAPRVRWVVTLDPAKALKINNTYTRVGDATVVADGRVSSSSLLLQDAHMTFRFGGVELDAGQFKLPLSREGSAQSSARLETVERAMFISSGKYGLVRDLGVMLSGSPVPSLELHLGAFNGAGENQNGVDGDAAKTLAGRAVLLDVREGLDLGLSGAWSGAPSDANVRRDRLGVEAQLVRGRLTLRSEAMRGWDGAADRLGYYGLAAYRVAPTVELSGRYDVWDADTRGELAPGDLREREWIATLGYLVAGPNGKIQTSVVRREPGAALPAETMLRVNFQTSW